MLPANLKRRTLSLAAAFAIPAAIVTAGLAAVPAQASTAAQARSPADRSATSGLSVTIDTMSPQVAAPGGTVSVSGTITNRTRQTLAGLDVQLYTSATHFTTRDGMDFYLSRDLASGLLPAGNPFGFATSVAPGSTVSWTASFQVSTQGIASFGVYPVTAQLQDLSSDIFASAQTLLPFWPGPRAAGLAHPLKISWLWPLVDQPQHQVCPALTSNDLAAELKQGGRLAALLDAGASHPGPA